jgi:hypothetical protein
MHLIDSKYMGLLIVLIVMIIPVECIYADLWESWGVSEGEEYEFSLDICRRFNSSINVNYTLWEEFVNSSNRIIASEGDHWVVTIQSVNESGIYQIITQGSLTSPNHFYPLYYSWFWGNIDNKSYWQEKVDLLNANKHPEFYSLEKYTLSGGIYSEHRIYKSGSPMIIEKSSIHIGKGITTDYEIEWNHSVSGSEFIAIHHLKFSLITDLGSSNELANVISEITDFFMDNPMISIALAGLIALTMTFLIIKRIRGRKKRSRRRR